MILKRSEILCGVCLMRVTFYTFGPLNNAESQAVFDHPAVFIRQTLNINNVWLNAYQLYPVCSFGTKKEKMIP